jgi:hypothetical protein
MRGGGSIYPYWVVFECGVIFLNKRLFDMLLI